MNQTEAKILFVPALRDGSPPEEAWHSHAAVVLYWLEGDKYLRAYWMVPNTAEGFELPGTP